MENKEILIYGTGDIMTRPADCDDVYAEPAKLFNAENAVVFGQLEATMGYTKMKVPQSRLPFSANPEMVNVLKRAGFDILSFGSNHSLDYGTQAFLETLDNLKKVGIMQVGSGVDEEDARSIRIIERDGVKIAFVGYCSILPQDYWAEDDRPGCNPARGITAYVPKEHDQPGTAVDIYTFPHPEDLQHMIEDIQKAKEMADIVVASFHWGIHFKKAVIADYQKYYAHFAIDAGADVVFGHHAHTLKPIEVYKGKVIFYSLGNFAMRRGEWAQNDILAAHKSLESFENSKRRKVIKAQWKEAVVPGRQEEYGWYCHTLAKCVVRDKKIVKVSYIPTYSDVDDVTKIGHPGNDYFEHTLSIMDEITAMENLKTEYKYDPELNEVILVDDTK